ncbi:MAG: S-layer protein domain-containing protein [Candidatus Bathyarchaeota archaeon]|nr:S-layer protein domain-containing protein [Candidatus Bathyarchaeota archaeon]
MKPFWMIGLGILLMIAFAAIPVHALEIRGEVATADFTWNPQNFAGFDYDIDRDIGSDTLTTTLTDKTLSGDYPYGIVYETRTGKKMFSNAKPDMEYGKLRVSTIDATTGIITLDNKDNAITLSKNMNTEILPGIFIRTADNYTLRYYIYKNITTLGTYEIRGSVATDSYSWNSQNFAGFYYDIKKDLGSETIRFDLSGDDGKTLSGDSPYGIAYTTAAQSTVFKFWDWGALNVMGFLGEEYFAGYVENVDNADENIMFRESTDENSLSSEQLQKILVDDNKKMTINKGDSIKFKEGYELFLKGINSDGQVYLELKKDGKLVDGSILMPSVYGVPVSDETYYYRTNVGSQKNLVIIAVHFRSIYKDEERALAVVDGIWQISDKPIDVKANTQYGKMTITSIDANAGNNDTLRYYIYRTETVG